MEGSQTNNRPSSRFDALSQPFRLLGIDPAATSRQIHAAYARALEQQVGPEDALISARAAILDPARRLSCELTYPIDSTPTDVETFYAALSSNDLGPELMPIADRLAPLSKANFVVHLAARRPAESALLLALIDAHVSIDAAEIYATLKPLRNRAEYPMPSLVSVNQGLYELFDTHVEVAIAGYDTIQGAAEPVLECTRQVLAIGERYSVEALSGLLEAYRRSTASLRSSITQQIELACRAIEQRPDEASSIDKLAHSLPLWGALCQPLILLDAHRGNQEREFEIPIDQVSLLLANLSAHHQYATARIIVNLALNAFSLLPGVVEQFSETSSLIDVSTLEAEIKSLHDSDPSLLVKALEKYGFGSTYKNQVNSLWHAFVRAVKSADSSELPEQPWLLIRDLAMFLGSDKASAVAASKLLEGMIQHGQDVSVEPEILSLLRDDLRHVKNQHHIGNEIRPVQERHGFRRFGTRFFFACLALTGMFCAFAVYRGFDKTSLRFLTRVFDSSALSETENIPSVGKGQHFGLDYVRYCHFQEERLRVIRQEVHGPQDFQAFNALAADYNSRCSDFYYQDEDQKTAIDEVAAKKDILEADARRILASWPWHAASGSAAAAPPTK